MLNVPGATMAWERDPGRKKEKKSNRERNLKKDTEGGGRPETKLAEGEKFGENLRGWMEK